MADQKADFCDGHHIAPQRPRAIYRHRCSISPGRGTMSALAKRLNVNLLCVVLAAGLALPTGIGFARAAEQPSAEQIIQALKPPRPRAARRLPPPTQLVSPMKGASSTRCATG